MKSIYPKIAAFGANHTTDVLLRRTCTVFRHFQALSPILFLDGDFAGFEGSNCNAYVDAVVCDAVVPESQLRDLGAPAHVLHRACAPVSLNCM